MDSTDTQSLSDDELGRLVSIALEEFGQGLNRSQFNEVMLAGKPTLSLTRTCLAFQHGMQLDHPRNSTSQT